MIILIKERCEPGYKCVLYYLCNDNGSIITDGRFFIDERSKRELKVINKCPMFHECCKIPTRKCPETTPVREEQTENNLRLFADDSDECGYGNNEDECKRQPFSLKKPACTEVFLKITGELRSGISNPQGFFGEVATYQNKASFAQYAQVFILYLFIFKLFEFIDALLLNFDSIHG